MPPKRIVASKETLAARISELERELLAYQEYFSCTRRNMLVVRLSNEGQDRGFAVEAIGLTRATGGVVIQGPIVSLATDWCARARASDDYAWKDLGERIERLTQRQMDSEARIAWCTTCRNKRKVCCSESCPVGPDGVRQWENPFCAECCPGHPNTPLGQ